LAQLQTVPVGYLPAPPDKLPCQFIIRGKGDVLLLDSGVNVNVLVVRVLTIDTELSLKISSTPSFPML